MDMRDLNHFVKDEDSDVTSHGKHNRLVVFYDKAWAKVEVREDDISLPAASLEDAKRAAMGPRRVHPRGTFLRYVRATVWESSYGLHRTFEFSVNKSDA
jgi:hypothetical protein